MDRLHGPGWRARAGSPRGAFRSHAVTVAVAAAAAALCATWIARTLAFAWSRCKPGPCDPRELATMLATSAAIPFAAVAQRVRGTFVARRAARRHAAAVLFDRDGTLVVDVAGGTGAAPSVPFPTAARALRRLRRAGIALGVITNQHRVGEGTLSEEALRDADARIARALGPFDAWHACTHTRDAGCACRKPRAGLVLAAAARLGVEPRDCVVVGDIGSDVVAAQAAGARAVLVPNGATLAPEIAAAPVVARDLDHAADLILAGLA